METAGHSAGFSKKKKQKKRQKKRRERQERQERQELQDSQERQEKQERQERQERQEQERRMAASATTHDGRLLLRSLSKEDVCRRLSERFPAVDIDFASLAASSLSVERIQAEVWNVLYQEISQRDNIFLFDLLRSHYHEDSRRHSQSPDWYRGKVSPFLLLRDVIFFSDVCNPAFLPNLRLEPLPSPLEHVYVHTKDLSDKVAEPEIFIQAARLCCREAVELKNSFADGEELSLFWHGTASVAAKGIVESRRLRMSGESTTGAFSDNGHDFGRGVYFFSEVLHALSFAVDRTSMQVDDFNREGNPALICMCIPTRVVTDEHVVEVNNYVGLTDSGPHIRDRSRLEKKLKSMVPFKSADGYTGDDYTVDDLDGWGQFVKYCHLLLNRPSEFSNAYNNVFHGALHDCKKVVNTQQCARPERDSDGWDQWCFTFPDPLTEVEGCRFFFFDLQHPRMFKGVTLEEYDDVIVKASREL